MGFGWYLMICLLLKGLFDITYSIQFACIGQDVHIFCPDENVDNWQKFETGDMLAVCENGMPKKNKSIPGKISISGSCNELSIMNFTKDDAGKYSCFTKMKENRTFKKYCFEVKLRIKPNVSIISSPQPRIGKGQTIELMCFDMCDDSGSINKFSWTHNGQILPNVTSSLLFKNADAEIAGEYKCTVRNGAAEDSDSINVSVTWIDGGTHQQFLVCFRKKTEKELKCLTMNNSGRSQQFSYISDLESSTEYAFKIVAINALGNRTSTKLYSIRTKQKAGISDIKKAHFTQYRLFVIIPVALLAALGFICWRLQKDDLPGPSSASHNRGDVYSSIDRRLQVSGVQTVNYKVSKNDNRKQQSEIRDGPSRITEDDFTKLNYVEVAFDSKMTSREFFIHGAENKTQYVDIDLLSKADPLCSADENDSSASSMNDNDDDFVSLEEIQKWRINEDT